MAEQTDHRPMHRSDLISPDHVRIALAQPTMTVYTEDGQDIMEIPIPEEVRRSGRIPEGFEIDFLEDPDVVIHKLRKAGMQTLDQIPKETLERIRGIVNSPINLKIIPEQIHQLKLEMERQEREQEMSGGAGTPAPKLKKKKSSACVIC